MSNNPKISVIIATYNRADLLPRAVNSVLSQTFTNHEIIIVDDCSLDNTKDIIAEFSDSRVRSISHDQNKGPYAAINTGIAQARGEYIAFLDDDDEFTPTSLEDRLAVFEAGTSQIALVYGWSDIFNDSNGKLRSGNRLSLSGHDVFEYALTGKGVAGTPSLMIRTYVAREIGGFDERLVHGNDFYFVCSVSQKYLVQNLPKVTLIVHESHGKPRITDMSEEKRRYLEMYYDLHCATFSDELKQRPKMLARLSCLRATYAMQHCRVSKSITLSIKAFKLHPLNLGNIRHIFRIIKAFIFYVSPISRYRSQAQTIQSSIGLRQE